MKKGRRLKQPHHSFECGFPGGCPTETMASVTAPSCLHAGAFATLQGGKPSSWRGSAQCVQVRRSPVASKKNSWQGWRGSAGGKLLPGLLAGQWRRPGGGSGISRAQARPELDEPSSPVPSAAPGSSAPQQGEGERGLVGEDAAVFELGQQKTSSWLYFTAVLGVVLAALYVLWIDPSTGYGTDFVAALSSLSDDSSVVMLAILFIFGLAHSGLASLRDEGEKIIGERAYRVLFGVVSLPLAVSAVVFFINHRYDGAQLWQLRTVPGVHELVWALSSLSFFFLYPSTFNLLEVAAVDKPKMHMWETGIMRITRHPQMVGQFMWCFAHTLWIGTSFTLATSLGLCAHHLFGVWNGDRRLAKRYGQAFEQVKSRTSVVPFAAILDGRQKLPPDYYKEFLRVPYFVVTALTLGAYFSHPLLQAGSAFLGW